MEKSISWRTGEASRLKLQYGIRMMHEDAGVVRQRPCPWVRRPGERTVTGVVAIGPMPSPGRGRHAMAVGTGSKGLKGLKGLKSLHTHGSRFFAVPDLGAGSTQARTARARAVARFGARGVDEAEGNPAMFGTLQPEFVEESRTGATERLLVQGGSRL